MTDLDRITQQPGMMGGRPCIRGMRVMTGPIVGDRRRSHIQDVCRYLEREDILQASQSRSLCAARARIASVAPAERICALSEVAGSLNRSISLVSQAQTPRRIKSIATPNLAPSASPLRGRL